MDRRGSTALRIILTVLSVLAVGFIFYNSAQNADESEQASSAVLESVNAMLRSLGLSAELSEHFIRKLAHFTEYSALGWLLGGAVYSYAPDARRLLMIAPATGLCVAVCDELIQLSSQGRSCQFSDVILDFSAVLTAVLLLALILCVRARKRKTKEGSSHE